MPIVRFLATEAENLTRCSELLTRPSIAVSNKNRAKPSCNIETREAHLDRRENCAKRNLVQNAMLFKVEARSIFYWFAQRCDGDVVQMLRML